MADSNRSIASELTSFSIALFRDVRGIRFLVMGGVNTLIGFLAYSLALGLGGEIWLALIVSNVLGIAFNFLTLGGVVFRDLSIARAPRFAFVYLFVYFLNWGCIYAVSAFFGLSNVVAQAVLVAPMALISYLLLNKCVFGRDPKS
jgi:putative flippase GtrA